MSEERTLVKELVQRILSNLGIVPGNNFGKVGITTEKHLIKEKIELDDRSQCPVWAGQFIITGSVIKLLTTKIPLGDKENSEELILLMNINEQIYGFRYMWHHDEDAIVLVKSSEDNWAAANLIVQMQIAVVIEKITQEGLFWDPCIEYQELFDVLLNLIEHEDE